MKQKSKVYPYFVPNQVLKSRSLNDAFLYADEQARITRANLFGHGILNGLEYSVKNGVLTITGGEAINSRGWYIQLPGKQEYRYAAEVFLPKDVADKVTPFNNDSLLSLLKEGGSRVAYACFKTEEEAREFHHSPTPISAIPISHYAVALVCGTRNHSRSLCSEDNCDINISQKDCEVWPVLVNILAPLVKCETVTGVSIPPIFQEMKPCYEIVQLEPLERFDCTHFEENYRRWLKRWIDKSLESINCAARVIAKDILGQSYQLKGSFKVNKSVWNNVFPNYRELMSRFHYSVVKVNRIFTDIKSYYIPDYCVSFLKDYALSMREFIAEYNEFAAKYPYLPLRSPQDSLIYLGSALKLDKEKGTSSDQNYRSHFLQAYNWRFQDDALRLERFLKRLALLSEAFYGISWQTMELPKNLKAMKLLAIRPGARISQTPIPFYYNQSYKDFKRCWRADNLSPATFVKDYDDDSLSTPDHLRPVYFPEAEEGMKIFPHGYQGKTINSFIYFLMCMSNTNGWDLKIDTHHIWSKKKIPDRMTHTPTSTNIGLSNFLGGITRGCNVHIVYCGNKVVTYAVSNLDK